MKESPEYQALQQDLEAAEELAAQRVKEIDTVVRRGVTPRLLTARLSFQILKSEIDAITYQIETETSESAKQSLQKDIDEIKARVVEVDLASEDGSGEVETVEMKFEVLQAEFLRLQERRVSLAGGESEGAGAGE